jgi:hypothetical protein
VVDKIKGLRIATRYATIADLVAKMHRYYDGSSLFVATRAAQRVGKELPFSIQLADGSDALRGQCVVLDAWTTPDNKFARPGLRLQLKEMAPESQDVLEQMLGARRAAMIAGAGAPRLSRGTPAAGFHGTIVGAAAMAPSRRGWVAPARAEAGAGPALQASGAAAAVAAENPLLGMTETFVSGLVESRLAEDFETAEGAESCEALEELDEAAALGFERAGKSALAQPWRVLAPPPQARASWAPPPAVVTPKPPQFRPAPVVAQAAAPALEEADATVVSSPAEGTEGTLLSPGLVVPPGAPAASPRRAAVSVAPAPVVEPARGAPLAFVAVGTSPAATPVPSSAFIAVGTSPAVAPAALAASMTAPAAPALAAPGTAEPARAPLAAPRVVITTPVPLPVPRAAARRSSAVRWAVAFATAALLIGAAAAASLAI